MLLIEITYAVFCIGLAYINFLVIDAGRRVYHALNGLVHLAAAAIAVACAGIIAGVCILLVARLAFDLTLNRLRDLPMNYVSSNPKSIVDRLEKWVFDGDGYLPKLVYLVALFILNIA